MSEARSFIPVRIAILTISDTRTLENDTSGQTLSDRVAAAGHALSGRKIVKDDVRAIRHVMRDWTDRSDIDAIITTGGTGLTGHDVTIEAIASALRQGDRRLSARSSTWSPFRRSEPRPSSRAPPPAW